MLGWIAAAAWAGGVYINGTYVDARSVAGVRLEDATVTFDDQGNVRIDAPGYRVQPQGAPAPAPPPPPRPVVAYGHWWLVTEDRGSAGHTAEVWINGQLAQTVRSGDGEQRLYELSRFLKLGPNTILVRSYSDNPSGGSLTLYLGAGGSEKGYFDMATPPVEFGLSASRSGTVEREYTLSVDR
ncbi:MAG: hypothetical protein ABMA64_24720 [Myxococcota bacterium]